MQVVVMGVPRSGTSAVAGVLRILGVYMGDRIKAYKHEDRDLFMATPQQAAHVIADRDAHHGLWGWKDPWIGRTVAEVAPYLTDPRYIRVTRDRMAAAESDARRNPNNSVYYALKRNAALESKMEAFLAGVDPRRVLRVRYEDLLAAPRTTVARIAAFIGVDPSQDMLERAEAFIAPGYRPL